MLSNQKSGAPVSGCQLHLGNLDGKEGNVKLFRTVGWNFKLYDIMYLQLQCSLANCASTKDLTQATYITVHTYSGGTSCRTIVCHNDPHFARSNRPIKPGEDDSMARQHYI